MHKTLLFLFICCLLTVFIGYIFGKPTNIKAASGTAWHQTYSPYRNLYVSPTGTGGTSIDYSGNSNNGILKNQPSYVAGKVTPSAGTGYALNLDGTDDYITLGIGVGSWGTSYSVEAWVKTANHSSPESVLPILGNWTQSSSGGVGQAFGIQEGKITFAADENGTLAGCSDSTMTVQGGNVDDDNWHHVAVTLNASSKIVTLYIDGNQSAQSTLERINTSCEINAMTEIGRTRLVNPNLFFSGSIDELRVYDSDLSALAIMSHYNSGQGLSGSAEIGLVLGYHFDEGTPGTADNPLSLTQINNWSKAGDQVLLKGGTYTGTFTLSNSGTSQSPIVFIPLSGNHVIIHGGLSLNGAHNWIWGLEITDPDNSSNGKSGINVYASGAHIINNIIHDLHSSIGIGEWNVGPGNVIYGNIIYNIGSGKVSFYHGIYTQNDYSLYGYKYYVNNIILDQNNQVHNSFNFHAYNTSTSVSGMYLKYNISKNGRFLVGGYGKPADNEVIDQNYFYQSGIQLGYSRPSQATITNNYIARGNLQSNWLWGVGETIYTQTSPNIFTGNEIYTPSSVYIDLRTSAYTSSGRSEGGPAIQPNDVFDNNTYGPSFSAFLHANNTSSSLNSISAWRTATGNASNTFDAHSQVVATPTTEKIFVIPNEYDASKAHIAVFNWGSKSSVNVDLSSMGLSSGDTYAIFDPKNFYGSAVTSGTYSGSAVSVPIASSAKFASFTVLLNNGSPPNLATVPVPAGTPEPTATSAPTLAPIVNSTTFTVTRTQNTNDGTCDAHCSLAEAVASANDTPGADIIEFNVPTSSPGYIKPDGSRASTKEPAGTYPTTPYGYFLFLITADLNLTDDAGVYINGYTQPNASRNTASFGSTINANIMIQIKYSGVVLGIVNITSNNNHLAGLNIIPMSSNILIDGGNNNWIEGNFLESNITGAQVHPNSNNGDLTIQNNGSNNIIGTDGDGTGDVGERNLFLGKATQQEFNVISGNSNVIAGNYMGTDKTGRSCSNSGTKFSQITLLGGTETRIGSNLDGISDSEEANILGCVTGTARGVVRIYNSSNNLVQGNYIGTTPYDDALSSFAIDGIVDRTGSSTGNVIKKNTIAHNNGRGIQLTINGTTGNIISQNSIYGNSDIGIDLGGNGITANDAGDVDTGINDLMNFPIINTVTKSGSDLIIKANLDFKASEAPFIIELFDNDEIDSSGQGEGQYFIGTVSTSSTGDNVSLTVPITGKTPTSAKFITATATNAKGSTSEFSGPPSDTALHIISTPPTTDGLIGYYKLDESKLKKGAVIVDSSPSKNNGKVINSVTSDTGIVSGAGQFNGATTNNGYIDLAPLNNKVLTSSGTVSVWAYPTTKENVSNRYVFQALGSSSNRFYIQYLNGTFTAVRGNPATSIKLNNPKNLQLNTWYNLTLSWDKTTVYGYLNGKLVSSKPYVSQSLSNGSKVLIGAQSIGKVFPGKIDEVRVYNKMLSTEQIATIYNSIVQP